MRYSVGEIVRTKRNNDVFEVIGRYACGGIRYYWLWPRKGEVPITAVEGALTRA